MATPGASSPAWVELGEDSGLFYYRLRYYDPVAGRFVSRDPLGLWGDPGQRGNGQSYCSSNPVNFVDPLGLEPNDDESATRTELKRALDLFSTMHADYSTEDCVYHISDWMMEAEYNIYGVRYVWTENKGWIDLLHFFTAAKMTWYCGEVGANALGWANEFVQFHTGDSSGHPLGGNEDLVSNAEGADFGDEYIDNSKSFSENVVEFIESECGSILTPPITGKSVEDEGGTALSTSTYGSGAHSRNTLGSRKPGKGGGSPSGVTVSESDKRKDASTRLPAHGTEPLPD